MPVNQVAFQSIQSFCQQHGALLVAVSKTKPVADIQELYRMGQRHFGENYVQELVEKQPLLPTDVCWHFIGHLQSNKVKYIAPFVHLIHGVDSFKLLKEINKQAAKNNRVIDVLLQMHIAQEETKFGLEAQELSELLMNPELEGLANIRINGLMGMASFSDNLDLVQSEFRYLKALFDEYQPRVSANVKFETLSMGMSADYELAVSCGSNLIRVGSSIFGGRVKQ